jgi:hypothetical protein
VKGAERGHLLIGGISFLMNTITLEQKDWPLVEPIVTGVFGNPMPADPKRDGFVALVNGDNKPGEVPFLHLETLYHFNCVYVPERFGKERKNIAMRLIRDAAHSIPKGSSGLWLSDRRVDLIASSVGAYLVHSEQDETDRYYVYRKDR